MRKNNGITLIALIITIIVMLILVAVSVNILIKSNLIGTAEKTVNKYKTASEEEANGGVIEINGKKYNSIEDYMAGKEKLPDIKAGEKASKNSNYNGAVIPEGFTVSKVEGETTIDEGLVIYLINDKTDEEIKNLTWSGDELENLKKTYDQFVWIPVTDANKMFMCQAKTADSECELKIEGNEVICQTHKTADATKSKKMAGRLYATNIRNTINSNLTTQTYDANSGLREPAIVTNYDESNTLNNIGLTLETLQEEYNSAVKKVIESKGFWIGRYETSGMSSNSGSDSTTTLSVVAGKVFSDGISDMNWYRMYKQQQNYTSQKGLDTKIQSAMIFGAAWDQAMIFANCATKTRPTNTSSGGETGNVEEDCYKNIYDLCGNLYEWTTEAISEEEEGRVSRGGHYLSSLAASFRNNSSPESGACIVQRF